MNVLSRAKQRTTKKSRSPWVLKSLPLFVITMLLFLLNVKSEFARSHAQYVDLGVYNRASEFLAAGMDPYSAAFDIADLRWQYPPFALFFVIPMQYIPFELLKVLWTATTAVIPMLVMVALILQRLAPDHDPSRQGKINRGLQIVAISLAASTGSSFINSTYLGQIGMILAAVVLFDLAAPESWRRVGRFHLPKGIGVGIATAIKLTPGIFIVHLLLTRQWRTAATAISTTLTAWALTFLVFPAYSRYTFLEGGLFRAATANTPERLLEGDNISAAAAFDRFRVTVLHDDLLTMPAWPKYLLIVVLAIFVLFVGTHLHKHGQQLLALIVIGIGSALVSPVAWLNHGVWLTMIAPALFAFGLNARDAGRRASADRYFIAGMAFIALGSFPAQFRRNFEILPGPWNGWYFALLMLGSVVALCIIGRRASALPKG